MSQSNLLDTPGHVDFTAEVERCLRVLDGAVVVFSAREGVEAQSETVWRQANKYNVPRIVFINKLDREGADFYRVLEEIGPRLNAEPVAIQIPVGQGPSHTSDPFRGVIDLIEMKLMTFDAADKGKTMHSVDLPEELVEDALAWRNEMLEKLYPLHEELFTLALEEKPLPPELIREAIRKGCIDRKIQPVLLWIRTPWSKVSNRFWMALQLSSQAPLIAPPWKVLIPKNATRHLFATRPQRPFCALVFKILPAKTGDFVLDSRLQRIDRSKLERSTAPIAIKRKTSLKLWQIHATKKERQGQINMLQCGDIACAIGPRDSITGDTLCDTRNVIELPSIQFAQAVISMAIEPENTTERKKLAEVLE